MLEWGKVWVIVKTVDSLGLELSSGIRIDMLKCRLLKPNVYHLTPTKFGVSFFKAYSGYTSLFYGLSRVAHMVIKRFLIQK